MDLGQPEWKHRLLFFPESSHHHHLCLLPVPVHLSSSPSLPLREQQFQKTSCSRPHRCSITSMEKTKPKTEYTSKSGTCPITRGKTSKRDVGRAIANDHSLQPNMQALCHGPAATSSAKQPKVEVFRAESSSNNCPQCPSHASKEPWCRESRGPQGKRSKGSCWSRQEFTVYLNFVFSSVKQDY